jgi:YfiH family protein
LSFSIDGRGILRFDPWAERDWLAHGFSTRTAGDFRDRTAEESAEMLGLDGSVILLKQVHSSLVLQADRGLSGAEPRAEGDGLVSATAGETIGVRIADCLPLLLLDPERRAVAAVHAGWRGSAAGIAAIAVEAMRDRYCCRPDDLEAVIGPCISATRYEVGEDVARHFDPAAVCRETPKPHVDLAAANRLQLESAGVLAEKVHGGVHCSYGDAERFHSHRRDAVRAGRMIAFIGLR